MRFREAPGRFREAPGRLLETVGGSRRAQKVPGRLQEALGRPWELKWRPRASPGRENSRPGSQLKYPPPVVEKNNQNPSVLHRGSGRCLRRAIEEGGSWDPLNDQFQRNQQHNPQDNRTIQHAMRAEARWRIQINSSILINI